MKFFWIATVSSLTGSLISTWLVETCLLSHVPLFGTWLEFHRSYNTGVAFGIELGALEPALITIALVAITVMAIRSAKTDISQIAFGLIIGGGLGNIVDRLIDGRVTDFISYQNFPTFNVADTCITFGVVMLMYESLMPCKD